jgi:hypothetical protein
VNKSGTVNDNDMILVKMTGNPLQMCLIVKIKCIYIHGVSMNLDFSGLKTGRSRNLLCILCVKVVVNGSKKPVTLQRSFRNRVQRFC